MTRRGCRCRWRAGLPARPSATGPSKRPGERGAEAVIPSGGNREEMRGHDGGMYGWWRRIGNRFARTGEFRAVATRCDGTGPGFRATIPPAAAVIAAR